MKQNRAILFILILLFSGVGLSRLKFQTDFTQILPEKVAQVQAVKSFHQYFDDDHQIIVHVKSSEGKVLPEDIEELAAFISEKIPSSMAVYESVFKKSPELFAHEVGRTWAISSPKVVQQFCDDLTDGDALRASLNTLKERIRSSFNSGKAIAHSYDPLGFMRHPGLAELAEAEYSFISDDGQSRFFFLKNTKLHTSTGYNQDAQWIKEVRKTLNEWNSEYDNMFNFGLTGGPIYNAEVGTGMMHDILGTVAITLSLIALLFLLMQRSFTQLLMLICLSALTFILTLGIMGWLMPSLSALSVAFAAILLGLIFDYAIVLLREAQHFPKNRHAIRKGMKKSITWAAFTTALVFSVLLLSSFPGVQQLGILILIGLITGALVMLWGVPLYLEKVGYIHGMALSRKARTGKKALLVPFLLILGSTCTLLIKGTPSFSFSLESIQPKNSEASRVQNELSEKFTSWSDLRTVVFAEADSASALEEKLRHALDEAKRYKQMGLITEAQLPAQMVPHESAYKENKQALDTLSSYWEQILLVCEEVGFTAEALKFDESIFQEIKGLPATLEDFKAIDRPSPLMKGMMTEHKGKHYFRGNVVLASSLTPESLEQMHAINSNGVTITGWGVLSATLEPLVKSDFQRIFLPAAILILLGLGLVFRNVKETLLVLFILITSLLTVNALMVWSNIDWNFLNGIALPLIVGIGIDYSIHLIFAMRRQGEHQTSVWRGVGLAITFCGLSSVIGFGSLTLTNNDLLKSLGWICALGVFITMFLTLLVIPPLWRSWCNK